MGKKVAILTNFQEFRPGYSLTGIVKDQIRMLKEHGDEPVLFVNEKYHGEPIAECEMRAVIPFMHLKDYQSEADLLPEHKIGMMNMAHVVRSQLGEFEIAFTHDFVFTGWSMPYGMGTAIGSEDLLDTKWLHWIHSIPSSPRDWWFIRKYGSRHKLVYPNKTDAIRVAECYRGTLEDVRVIPHIKDLRTWQDFDLETCEFINEYPAVMQAEVVQVYPASVDRLEAKRVREIILLFANIKRMGHSVCLVLANQWATTVRQKDDIEHYKRIVRRNGLDLGTEVIFTSEWKNGKYDVGLPKRILRELESCMNLFIFPTREESFGLVLPEAALAGNVYCVVNKSLTMMLEVSGFWNLAMDFGSYHSEVNLPMDEKTYFENIAKVIIGRMMRNESLMFRTFVRRSYNYDFLYNRYYGPIMEEAKLW